MKKLIKDFGCIKYYDENKRDIWNNKILTRYIINFNNNDMEIFAGYIYKRSKKEINKLKKEYGKNVGINEFYDCPIEYVNKED